MGKTIVQAGEINILCRAYHMKRGKDYNTPSFSKVKKRGRNRGMEGGDKKRDREGGGRGRGGNLKICHSI